MAGTDKVVLEATPKKSTKQKKASKAPKGDPTNPHSNPRSPYIYDIKEGVTEYWIIQEQRKKNGKWHDEFRDGFSSYKMAQATIKEIQDEAVSRLEWRWKRENLSLRKGRVYRVEVGPEISKDYIDKVIKEINDEFQKVKENAERAPEKPKFTLPEYPKYRAVRRTVTIETEVPK